MQFEPFKQRCNLCDVFFLCLLSRCTVFLFIRESTSPLCSASKARTYRLTEVRYQAKTCSCADLASQCRPILRAAPGTLGRALAALCTGGWRTDGAKERRLPRHRTRKLHYSSNWNAAAVLAKFLKSHIDEHSRDTSIEVKNDLGEP